MCSFMLIGSRVDAAPLYGFNENGDLAVVGTIPDSESEPGIIDREEALQEEEEQEEVKDDGESTVIYEPIQDVSEDSLETPVAQEALDPVYDDYSDDSSSVIYVAASRSVNTSFNPDSCIQYQASAAGYSGILMIPTSFRSSIYLDDNGILWNVGASSIVGRLFTDRTISSGDYEQYIVTIRSCLSNNASNVYSGGSFSSVQHYYLSSGRITSDTTYGDVEVTEDLSTYSKDDQHIVQLYLLIIIFILLAGGVICYSKHWKSS